MLGLSALSFFREIQFLSKTFVGRFKSVSFWRLVSSLQLCVKFESWQKEDSRVQSADSSKDNRKPRDFNYCYFRYNYL